MRDYPHLIARIFNTPLMIAPHKARTIVAALASRLGVAPAPLAELPADIFGAVPRSSPRLDNDGYKIYDVAAGGVAVINVCGTLVHTAATANPPSGMISYDEIGTAFDTAMADASVRAVLLDIDSPGGEASDSAFGLADRIRQARTVKPVWAIADEMACSAAYLIASAASRFFVPALGYAGSIGVYALHLDVSGRDKKEGLTWTYIFAGTHKVDGNPHEPLDDGTRKEIQADVNVTYARFLDSVALGRPGLGADGARKTEARIYRGDEAVEAGLADGVMDFRAALAALTESLDGSSTTTGLRPRAEAPNQEIEMTNPAKPAGNSAPAATTQQPNQTAAAPPAPTPAAADANVVQLDAARSEGEQRAMAYMQEVTDLCALAGVPQKAAEFIRAKAAIADVRKALIDARAATADAAQIAGRHAANAGAGTQVPTIDAASIYAARAKSMGQAS